MKRCLIVIFCLLILLSACHQENLPFTEPTAESTAEPTQAMFWPEMGEVYTYCREDGAYLMQFVRREDDCINFRIATNSPEVDRNDAWVYFGCITENDGDAVITCGNEFRSFTVNCGWEEATVSSNDEEVKGIYYPYALEPEPYPEIPPLPEFVPDTNTDGFVMDASLAAGIRESEGLPSDALLTKEFLAGIRELYIWNSPLVTLRGIEYLENLESISTDVNYLRDLSELTKLPKLRVVRFNWGYITDIPDLGKMPALEELSVTGNMISDLTPLTRGKNLRFVNLDGNRITSVAPIRDMHSLTGLSLRNNAVTDYSCIADNAELASALAAMNIDLSICLRVEEKAKQIVSDCTAPGMTDLEKEYALYRYVIDHTDYDDRLRPDRPFGYYVLMENYGVCGDYAEGLTLLARMAGLDMICISSTTHEWNLICLDGKFYHVDALWDENTGTIPQYFNRSGSFILSQMYHDYDLNGYPEAEEMELLCYAHLLER